MVCLMYEAAAFRLILHVWMKPYNYVVLPAEVYLHHLMAGK